MAKRKQDDRLRNYNRIQIKVYKDMIVTFSEFFEAIKQIGYKEVPSETHYKFMPPEGESALSIPKEKFDGSPRTPDENIWTPNFFSYSQNLYLRYEINELDDLAKMIEKNRKNAKAEMAVA
jgi:hypothetical protein